MKLSVYSIVSFAIILWVLFQGVENRDDLQFLDSTLSSTPEFGSVGYPKRHYLSFKTNDGRVNNVSGSSMIHHFFSEKKEKILQFPKGIPVKIYFTQQPLSKTGDICELEIDGEMYMSLEEYNTYQWSLGKWLIIIVLAFLLFYILTRIMQ